MGKYIRYNTPDYFCLTCETQKTADDFYRSNKKRCKKCVTKRTKQKYHAGKGQVVAQGKILRVMEMTLYMAGAKRTLEEIAARFDISERTARRYLTLVDTLDLGLEQDFDNRYFLAIDSCPLCGRKHDDILTTNNHYETV